MYPKITKSHEDNKKLFLTTTAKPKRTQLCQDGVWGISQFFV